MNDLNEAKHNELLIQLNKLDDLRITVARSALVLAIERGASKDKLCKVIEDLITLHWEFKRDGPNELRYKYGLNRIIKHAELDDCDLSIGWIYPRNLGYRSMAVNGTASLFKILSSLYYVGIDGLLDIRYELTLVPDDYAN